MSTDPCSSVELVTLINGINRLLKERRFDSIDTAFACANVEKMKVETMLCWIRTTYAVRENIPRWKTFMREIADELEERGHDANGLLMGLGLNGDD